MGVFSRNLTSILLENALRKALDTSQSMSVLEVGCGDANISRAVAVDFPRNRYFGSDISEESIHLAQALSVNSAISNMVFKTGPGLEPWFGYKFDLIVCDVSAINSKIATLSDWYEGVSCDSGADGLGAIRPIVSAARNYLLPSGRFLIPSISLSNTDALAEMLNSTFSSVVLVESQDWPMPQNMSKSILLNEVPNFGTDWHLKTKFGIDIANTGIFLCVI